MNIFNNSRYQLTEEKIQKALFSLLRFMKFENIFIKDICREAGINRSSFYSHFDDINDLMIKTETKLSKKIEAIFKPLKEFTQENFIKLFEFLLENKDFYHAYLQTTESSYIEKSTFFKFEKPLRNTFNHVRNYDDKELLYHMTFFAGGLKALSKHWILSGCKETPEQMANIIFNEYKYNSKYFINT